MLRVWTSFGLFVLLFLAITGRLFYWQVIEGDHLRAQAATQYSTTVTITSSRGWIVATDGSPLVLNQPAYLAYAKPNEISNLAEFARKIIPVLSLDESSLLAQLQVPGRMWVPLAKKIDEETKNKLQSLTPIGLGFEKEPKRYYAESSMAAHLLGFVGSDDSGHDTGYFGVEGYYDRQLRGHDGSVEVERDVSGAPILLSSPKRVNPKDGRTLVLWLDKTVQHIAEEGLMQGIKKYGATEGSVVVLDPKTGGVLAMASFPTYAPGFYTEFQKELYKNPAVAISFEPGSTFKVLIMAAAIEDAAVNPSTEFNEEGPLKVNNYAIRTWNNQYHGKITMTQVLQYSSNVGMVFVGNKLGRDKVFQYIKNFGFGELTGVDLQDEATPPLRDRSGWSDIDFATATFGQGIAVTPLQMVRAVSAIANGGWIMKPKVVRAIKEENGKIVEIKPERIRRIIRESTAQLLTEMMVSAVDNGEAKWAKPKGYRIAGKTGTAQIPVAGHYDEKKTIASFVGFAPADNPRFIMLVTLREPTSSPWGSETAAPLFFSIAKDLFLYFGIPTTQ